MRSMTHNLNRLSYGTIDLLPKSEDVTESMAREH